MGADTERRCGEDILGGGNAVRFSGISGTAGIPSRSLGSAFMYLGWRIALGVAGRPTLTVGLLVLGPEAQVWPLLTLVGEVVRPRGMESPLRWSGAMGDL